MMNIPRQLWTPNLVSSQTADNISIAYGGQRGVWTQASSNVQIAVDVQFTPTYTTTAGFFAIAGLPTAAMPPIDAYIAAWVGSVRIVTGITWPVGMTQLNLGFTGQGLGLYASGTGVASVAVPWSAFASGTSARVVGTISLIGFD